MASYSHEDLDLEARLHTPKHRDWKGSEQGADLWSLWLVEDGADVDAIIADLLQESERAGWAFDTLEPAPTDSEETFWRAQKYLNEGLAHLTVHLDPSSLRGGIDISMRLDFGEEDIATPILVVERDASYEGLAELRDAIEGSGIRCTLFTSETGSGSMNGSEVAKPCNEHVRMHVFDSHDETQAYLQRSTNSASTRSQTYLVGPNWIVRLFDNEDLAAYLQGELGGELADIGAGT